MMGDDRPFVCSAPGCGQSFTNEDHLAVHKHKHEMTLKFGSARDGVIVATRPRPPTRFLKNCEEVGLFNELANPFEQDFKKADEEEIRKVSCDARRGRIAGPASGEKRLRAQGHARALSVNRLYASMSMNQPPPPHPLNI
ncbi:cyclic AMP-dependent transcription factor ATF-2-like [Chiloscyllium punctatum]|uniref:cyclic AMP-dependent transcription factor ATF-2-like n=1 Tax=Chiloscyllium punctatum TaxID=137246 RepID=UPI003B63B7CC